MTLDDEINGTLAAVQGCIDRLRSVNQMRQADGKSIAPGRVVDALRLRDSLNQLILELPAPADEVNELLGKLRQRVL